MGVGYSAHLVVGFMFEPEELTDLVETEIAKEEESHYADRVCPKTGKKLKPELIIDSHKVYKYTLWDKEISEDEAYEIYEAICERFGCKSRLIGDPHDIDNYNIIFYPKMPKETYPGVSAGRFKVGPSYSYEDILKMKPALDKLKKQLEEIELEPEESIVANAWSIG